MEKVDVDVDLDDLENHVNPFSLTGARCRLRSPSARKSQRRRQTVPERSEQPEQLEQPLTALRHAQGSAVLDPDAFFAEIGIDQPLFSQTGKALNMLPKPTPVSTVLGPKGKTRSSRSTKVASVAKKEVVDLEKAFLTDLNVNDLIPSNMTRSKRPMTAQAQKPTRITAATPTTPLATTTPIRPRTSCKASDQKMSDVITDLEPRPIDEEKPSRQRRMQSPYRVPTRDETRRSFAVTQALKQLTSMQAKHTKELEKQRKTFDNVLWRERAENLSNTHVVEVLRVQLEAAQLEIKSLRNALRLLMTKGSFEHSRLMDLELESQGNKDAQALLTALNQQFLHMPPEKVLTRVELLEEQVLKTFTDLQESATTIQELEQKLEMERKQHKHEIQRLTSTLTDPIAQLEEHVKSLTDTNTELKENGEMAKTAQERYLALSFAIADLWTQWIDPKTHGGSVARILLGATKEGGTTDRFNPQTKLDLGLNTDLLHPDLSRPFEILRCIKALLSMCYPKIDASGRAFRKVAALANRAWSRVLAPIDTECLLKYDIYGTLEECCRRAEEAEAREARLRDTIQRQKLETKRLYSEVGRLEKQIRKLTPVE